jgi:hypothetical protein
MVPAELLRQLSGLMQTSGIFSWRALLITCALLAASLPIAQNANAAGTLFSFDTDFSGLSTPPAGPGPWTTATFLDVAPGTVDLTIDNIGLSSGEFISGLYFNLNPLDDATGLTFNLLGTLGTFAVPTISLGRDDFKADGDGKYDILFGFGTASGTTFTVGNSITFRITGIAGLTAADFNFLSAPAGGSGPFYAAAHVQGTPPNNGGSCWIEPGLGPMPVPEPSSSLLLAMAAGMWFTFRRRASR